MTPLTGPQIKKLRDGLLAAYPSLNALQDLSLYGLNQPLARVVALPAELDYVTRDLIRWTEARGRTGELVAAALNDAPKNQLLRQAASDLNIDGGAGQFESIVHQRVQFNDVEQWRDGMIRSEQAVCRVEVDIDGQVTGVGTGFLIANDLLITNYHVLEDFMLDRLNPSRVTFHFDYKNQGGKLLKGVKYKLAPVWKVYSSTEENFDFALVRLVGSPGTGTLGEQENAPVRGFLTPAAKAPEDGEPLMIIQHPKAVPLKFALGSMKVQAPPAGPAYLTYDVNTDEGSSGSPCFTSDWTLVALHHWGGTFHNRGIRFSAILQELQERNISL
jgi:V8-like Glu-specific endopeptidase